MKQRRWIIPALILTGSLMWLACSGGGSGGSTAGGGIGGSGVRAAGVVTALGSIYVNGVRYETADADVTREGTPLPPSRLTEGMLVDVYAGADAGERIGTADRVEVLVTLRGLIESVEDRRIAVLGQEVLLDEDTETAGRSGGLTAGDAVEVSGLVRANGLVAASRVDVLESPPVNFKVTGSVRNPRTNEFQIGALTIRYDAQDLDGFGAAGPQEGDFAAASGRFDGIRLSAESVRRLTVSATDSQDVDLEGYLADARVLISPLGPVGLQLNALTEYIGGTDADLATDARLQARGILNGDTLVAETITFARKVKVEATLADADPGTGRIALTNLPGLPVQADTRTTFQDRRSNDKPVFPSIIDTLEGDEQLWIMGWIENGILVATKIRIDPQPADLNRVILTAQASQINQPDFRAVGLRVHTHPGTTFENADGSSATFDSLTGGISVRVEGESNPAEPDTITADKVNIEENE